jgi:thiol:disulfide interchange protein
MQQVVPSDTTADRRLLPQRNPLGSVFPLLAGLGGLLTPCVYPMIPMTVSYFLRGNKSESKAMPKPVIRTVGCFAYTLIGVLVAIFKNPTP